MAVWSTATVAAGPDKQEAKYFDIPQQRADVSLITFAEQADITLIFTFELARDKTTNRLVGTYNPEEAIQLLLQGTGLKPTFSSDGYINIAPDESPDAEGDEMNAKQKTGLLAALASLFTAPGVNAQDAGVEQIEEIVVRGERSRLARALEEKRAANGVLDSVVANDLGQFPDLNISESLQRVPGVTITRNLGEGEQVSVRGLAPQFTGVLINGMQAASAAQGDDGNITYGRALTFDLFPSELFRGATIYKSPTASLQDGGLSATIDMQLPRPFDLDGFTLSSTAQASENELTNETNPGLSFLVSNTSADGRVGGTFQAAYAETLLHGELAEGLRFDTADFDLDGDGTPEFTGTDFARLVRTGVEQYDRERIGFTGTLQFRPSDNVEIIFDAMYGETERKRDRHTLDGNLFGNGPDSPLALTVVDNVAVAGTFANENRRSENIYNTVDTEFSLFSLSGDWTLDGDWSADARVGVSNADFARDEVRIGYQVNDPEFSYDLTGDPRYPVTGSSATIDLADPSQFTLSQVRHHPLFVEDDNLLAELNFNKALDGSAFTSISFGAEFRSQEREFDEYRQDRDLSDPTYLSLTDPVRTLSNVGGTTLRGQGFRIFGGQGPSGLLRNFAVPSRGTSINALIDPNFDPARRFLSVYGVEEDITAAYFRADFESGALSGDIGIRYARTEQTSSSFSQGDSGPEPISASRDYDNWLPSANLRWEINDELLLRVAASIGMTRPTLNEISPSQNIQLGSQTVSINNPDLDPFEANQLDVSLEWYFDDEALLALTYFYKDIDSLVTRVSTTEPFFGDNLVFMGVDLSGEDFLVSRLVNGDGATLNGVEIAYQQPFTFLPEPFDGLGVMANFTYADSESTVTFGGETFTAPIQGQSETSYNFLVYYEKGGFSTRAAYSWRDDFLIIRRGADENRFQDDTGYLDFTASYQFTDQFKISFDVANLTSEDSYRYDVSPDFNIAFANYGRVMSLRAQYILQ